jgi:hypothetical protein
VNMSKKSKAAKPSRTDRMWVALEEAAIAKHQLRLIAGEMPDIQSGGSVTDHELLLKCREQWQKRLRSAMAKVYQLVPAHCWDRLRAQKRGTNGQSPGALPHG